MKLLVDYKCSKCNSEGVKLWRQYNTFTDHLALLCLPCAEKDQKKRVNLGRLPKDENDNQWERPTDQVGWLVPAIPVDGEATYWGYTAVPDNALVWWHLLPAFKDDPHREIEWLRAWGHATLRDHLYDQVRRLRELGIEPK